MCDMSDKSGMRALTDNIQFFILHGSQNLCQTIRGSSQLDDSSVQLGEVVHNVAVVHTHPETHVQKCWKYMWMLSI